MKKHSPSCHCDRSRLVATTLMHSIAHSHHLLIQLTCLQLTCFPHLTAAESARTRFPGQSQPCGIPPDSVGMQAPWEILAQQSFLSLWFGCGNYPRRSNNNRGEVYLTASTQNLPLTQACSSQHTASLAPATSRELEQVPKITFVAIENVLERTRCCIIIFSSLRTCLQN